MELPRAGERWERALPLPQGEQRCPFLQPHSSECSPQPGEPPDTRGSAGRWRGCSLLQAIPDFEIWVRNPHSSSLAVEEHRSVQPSLQRLLLWLHFCVGIPSQLHAGGFHPAIPTARYSSCFALGALQLCQPWESSNSLSGSWNHGDHQVWVKKDLKGYLCSWAGTPSTAPVCSEPHPARPKLLPGLIIPYSGEVQGTAMAWDAAWDAPGATPAHKSLQWWHWLVAGVKIHP